MTKLLIVRLLYEDFHGAQYLTGLAFTGSLLKAPEVCLRSLGGSVGTCAAYDGVFGI